MGDLKFSLPGADTVTLSRHTVDRLLRAGDGDAALLYLYILKTGARSSTEETMADLGKGPGWIATGMAVLSRIGLIELDGNNNGPQPVVSADAFDGAYSETSDTEPTIFTTADMKRDLEAGSDFSVVVEETQRAFGRILSPDELMRLYAIHKKHGMTPEVIMQLIIYCINESKRAGAGRTLSMMRYVEKAADTWAGEGVLTLEKAEEYIKKLEDMRHVREEMKTVMQIRDREFSAMERKYVDGWIALGFDIGAVEIAYEKMIEAIHEYKIGYMNGILNKWHKKDIHTVSEIFSKEGRRGKGISDNQSNAAYGVADKDEIGRMQRLLDKTKGS